MRLFRLAFSAFFCLSLDYFVLELFAFVVLSLLSSVLYREIGWEERLRNDLFLLLFFITSNDSIKVKNKKDIYRQSHTRQQTGLHKVLRNKP